ncbi:H-SHIPPO [Hexamita inflata]|uniref:H-SHIPPO n=1 Tax=Hexamita inflata TaxID=28002 RepID=A0AA86NJ03_9EUKA|nr:H-SHIPPO [Hexamita inflata]CAI9958433.1 H-SHIPPO [Hexamita inflata]
MIAAKDILNQHLHNQLKLPSVVSKNILKGARLEPKPNIQRTQSPGPIYYPESKSNYMSRSKYVYIKNKTVELKRAESPSPIDYSPKRDVSSPLLNIHERIQNIYEKKPQTSTKVGPQSYQHNSDQLTGNKSPPGISFTQGFVSIKKAEKPIDVSPAHYDTQKTFKNMNQTAAYSFGIRTDVGGNYNNNRTPSPQQYQKPKYSPQKLNGKLRPNLVDELEKQKIARIEVKSQIMTDKRYVQYGNRVRYLTDDE